MEPPDESKKKEFIAAYDAYAGAIYRYCYFRVFSQARAEELMQEAFMKTWQYIAAGKEVENLRAFLYRVAGNLIIDDVRRHTEASLEALTENSDAFEPVGEDGRDMEHRLFLKEVRMHLTMLSPEDHNLIVMRFVNELTPQEIGSALGITPNNASVRLNRAMKRLKKHLAHYDRE